MHQAQVDQWGQSPKYVEVPEPAAPGPDEVRIKVEATGVHRVVKSRAAGRHYSARALPHIPGVDGVGMTDDGRKVYFSSMSHSIMAEYINMPKSTICPIPAGTDPVQIAASVNPAMSSWMAFKTRTTNLPPNFTCLILGATSASGRVAIPLARSLGAKKVIGATRNKANLEKTGVDEAIVIAEKPEETDFSNLDDVDVVIDYVYGPLALHLFKSLNTPKPVQYVHIGALSVPEITLPGDILRSKNLTIRGSGPGAWSMYVLHSFPVLFC